MAERIDGTKANTTHAAEFVRSLPAELTLREMHEKVKAAGHAISHARVYQIRRDEKLGFKYMTDVPPEPIPKTAPAPTPPKKKKKKVTAKEALAAIPVPKQQPKDDARAQLRKLAFQIGIERLEAHLVELKRELGI